MKRLLIMCAAILLATTQLLASEPLNLKDITSGRYRAETLSAVTPLDDGTYAQISADGKKIVKYSYSTGKQVGVLFDVDNTQGKHISGFDGYIMSPDGTKMLIRTETKPIYRRSSTAVYYIYYIGSRKLTPLSDYGPQQVPTWSPDGHQVAFVRDNNIYLIKLLYDNAESQVTKDGKFNNIINGVPDWVNEEEFGFNRALAFNADGTMICWIKYDESQVKTYSLQLFKGLSPERSAYATYPGEYSYKYPKAGEVNSKVSVWSFDIKSRQARQLQVPVEADGYVPRLKATSDPDKMIVLTMNRHQDALNVYGVNPRTTISHLLVKESASKYVKEEVLDGIDIVGDEMLLPSDRDGYMHLYVYNLNGQLQRKVIGGQYDITDFYGMDAKTGDIYYQAACLNPMDRQVMVAHKNGKIERLSKQEGWNSAVFAKDYKNYINVWSDRHTPQVTTLCNNRGSVQTTLLDNAELKKTLAGMALGANEQFSFTTSEGVKLNGWMVKPADFDANKKYPVIMFQYSGPGSQQVVNSWNCGSMGQGCLFDQYLAQHGFIVVCVDGRGTGGRGSEFEKSVYLKMGDLESKDQVETALWLGKQGYVDKDRIGIWGWSFGGFNTLMSMSEGRGVFRAGVAVAPPTSWRFYDTIYTERYMRTPGENPTGYDDNPISRAERLHGSLLICHGLADDNVHPQNTFEYTEALVQADKDFKMNIYTNRNHSIFGGNTRNHLLRQITEFFEEKMK